MESQYSPTLLTGETIESGHIFTYDYVCSSKLKKAKTQAKCWSAALHSVKLLLVPNTSFGFAALDIAQERLRGSKGQGSLSTGSLGIAVLFYGRSGAGSGWTTQP